MRKTSLQAFFESRYTPVTESGCWIWLGACTGRYGIIAAPRPARFSRMAHRVAYELANGPIPENLCVCHSCDVTLCVNPAHLFLGTQNDNVQDMIRKGRKRISPLMGKHGNQAKGQANGQAKASEETVITIRKQHAKQPVTIVELARRFCLSESQVARIIYRESWKHI